MFDFISIDQVPLYGILGGAFAAFAIAFTCMWVWEELFAD